MRMQFIACWWPACLLAFACFCACSQIIFYCSIAPGRTSGVFWKSTLSLKTWSRSPQTLANANLNCSRATLPSKTWCRSTPKTVAKQKFDLLSGNLSIKNVVSIAHAKDWSETQIWIAVRQPFHKKRDVDRSKLYRNTIWAARAQPFPQRCGVDRPNL